MLTPASRPLQIQPQGRWGGTFEPPGDKSITHRAYLFGLMAHGETRVTRPNVGADCDATLSAAGLLGAGVSRQGDTVTIVGRGDVRREPGQAIDCGNSGTLLRLLAGIVAAQPGRAVLDGDASLRARPVGRIIAPLAQMGARIEARDGNRFPPLVVEGRELVGIDYDVPVASAQVQSCVLLAGLSARGRTSVTLPGEARDHTARMLPAFGVEPEVMSAAGRVRVTVQGGATLRAVALRVPGDFSSAAFFLAAAAATPGVRVTACGVGLNPTRTGLLDVLESMGAIVTRKPDSAPAGEPAGEVSVEGPERLRPFDVPESWLPRLIDEVPAWTLAAAAAGGTSRLSGAAELRLKESDRLAMLASQLTVLGVRVTEHPDGLEIIGGPVTGGNVSCAGDHRIAMTLALFGLRAAGPVTVDDAASIGTSYPEFLHDLDTLAPGARMGESLP